MKRAIPILLTIVAAALEYGCLSTREPALQDMDRSRSTDDHQQLSDRNRDNTEAPAVSGRLTLEDAVKLALLYNKELQAAAQTPAIAAGRMLEAKAKARPSVTARGSYTRLDVAPYIVFGGQTLAMGVADNYSASLEVRQTLYAGGAIQSALRAAQLGAALGDAQVRAQVQKTLDEVIAGYYDCRLARHLFEVKRDAVKSAEAHLDDVAKRHTQGMASDYDVLRAEVEVSNFKAEMIRERNHITRATTALIKTMGVTQEQTLELADELVYAPRTMSPDEAVRTALTNRPELAEAELDVRVQREALRIAHSAYLPRVDAVFAQSEANPSPHTPTVPGWGSGWAAGIALELPLFDAGREGRAEEEEAKLRQREAQLADMRERVLLQVRQALLSVQDAQEFVESQTKNLERAAESLRLVELGYRQGIQSLVEVTDTQAAMTQTRGLYYQAIYDHCMARLALERAMGRLDVQQGTPKPESGEAAPTSGKLEAAPLEGSGAKGDPNHDH